jgi:thymidylate kinase
MAEPVVDTNVDSCVALPKGRLVLELLSHIEAAGHRVVYLRNYENLPDDIGNDVDLLIEKRHTCAVLAILQETSPKFGWRVWKTVPFACLSIFLISSDNEECIHIDLFEELGWHFFSFAEAEGILDRRIWNGMVFTPALADEVYINIVTRLVYQGFVREKHREQWVKSKTLLDQESLQNAFCSKLLGPVAGDLIKAMSESDWKQAESLHGRVRRAIMRNSVKHPIRLCGRVFAYVRRVFSRTFSPPGLFIAFTGADGVGKSTIIQIVVPRVEESLGVKDTLYFHWKPLAKSISKGEARIPHPHDPRGNLPRSRVASSLYLIYHWLTFKIGFIRYVLPNLAKNRLVIADRYACDVWLDPRRFRIDLPKWILKMFVKTLPQPDITLALVAKPQTIIERKKELELEEIEAYQNRILSAEISLTVINANDPPSLVAETCFKYIMERL